MRLFKTFFFFFGYNRAFFVNFWLGSAVALSNKKVNDVKLRREVERKIKFLSAWKGPGRVG